MTFARIGQTSRRGLRAVHYCLALTLFIGAVSWAAQPEEISFSYFGTYKDNELWRQICEDFERENPGAKIKRLWYVGDTGRKLQLQIITGTAADVIQMDDEVFPVYSVRGYLEDLRPYIERRSDSLETDLAAELGPKPGAAPPPGHRAEPVFLPTSLDSFNYQGVQGGLPWCGNVVLMFYNQDLFDAAGLPYPDDNWTMADFRSLSKQLTRDLNGDGRIDQFGSTFVFSLLGVEPFVWSFGGEMLNADQTHCAIQEPAGREAIQFLYDMKYRDGSVADSSQPEGFTADVQLLTGRLAMVPSASHLLPVLNRVKDAMRWGVAQMPAGPYGDRFTRVTWDGISVNAHITPAKKELAWRFLKHVVNQNSQAAIGRMKRGLPIRRAQAASDYASDASAAGERIALEATIHGKLTPITPRYMELRDAFNGELDKLNMAEHTHATPVTVLETLAPKVDAVLQKVIVDFPEAGNAPAKTRGPDGSGVKALALAAGMAGIAMGMLLLVPPVRAALGSELERIGRIRRSRRVRLQTAEGILFASPWLLGFAIFTAFPVLFSIVLSFCEWDPFTPISNMHFVGLDNFRRAFSTDAVTGDPLVLKALYNTFYYAIFSVPLGLAVSLGLAILLNQKVRGIAIFRTVFYVPSIISGVATVILWTYILNPTAGPLNGLLHLLNGAFRRSGLLAFIHLPEPGWLMDPAWSKPAMILMTLWGAGGAGMLIFLAGLQGVPDQLYEVAELDGAGRLRKFWNVTLPMLTPTIYFNLIMGIIASLKVFMQAYVMTNGLGGVDKSLLFYVLHLYNKAFVDFEMGYASALAWILFTIILTLTLLAIRSSSFWVYYEGEVRR